MKVKDDHLVTTEERLKNIEEKLDIVLHILGHGRTKSHAQIEREAEANVPTDQAHDRTPGTTKEGKGTIGNGS